MDPPDLESLLRKIQKSFQGKENYSYPEKETLQAKALDHSKSTLEKYLTHSPEVARLIANQATWYPWASWRLDDSGSPQPGYYYTALNGLLDFYDQEYRTLSILEPLVSTKIVNNIDKTLRNWTQWSWDDIRTFTKNLIDFSVQAKPIASADCQVSLLKFFGALAIKTRSNVEDLSYSYPTNDSKKHLTQLKSVAQAYLSLLKVWSSDRLGLGKLLLDEIAVEYYLPTPNPESGELVIDEKRYLKKIFEERERQPVFGSVFDRVKKLNAIADLYLRYFGEAESLKNFSDIGLVAKATMSFFRENDYSFSKLENLFKILSREQCPTIEEAVECALLDIPSYQISRKLGQGVYKNVFRGRNVVSQEDKALKVVDISERGIVLLQKRKIDLQHFISGEARKSVEVKAIDNPYLIKMEEIRYESSIGRYVIYEELFDRTLENIVQERKLAGGKDERMELPFSYATQIASGLAALHQQGMVHGDLTLSNIGVKDGMIKITDFGLASSLGSLALETRERDAGCLLVRAPELFDEKSSPTEKSDVWSLGVIVYKLETGEYPPFIPAGERPLFPGPERSAYETEVLRRIKETKLESLYESFPGQVKHLLKSCLQKEPEKRKTMKEIHDSLRRWYFHFKAIYSEQCNEVMEHWEQWDKERYHSGEVGETWHVPFTEGHSFDYIFLINQKKRVLVQEHLKVGGQMGRLRYEEEKPHHLLRNFESPSLGHALTCWIASSLKNKELDPHLGLDPYNEYHGRILPHRRSLIISHPSCREELEDYLVDVDELSDAEFRRLSYSPPRNNDNNDDEDYSNYWDEEECSYLD